MLYQSACKVFQISHETNLSCRARPNFTFHMNIDYDFDKEDIRYMARYGRGKADYYTHWYPTDKIRQMKFETSEEVSTFLLKNAMEIGYCKWQLFQKEIIDKGDVIKIIYSCRIKLCQATLIYYQKKITEGGESAAAGNGRVSFPKKYYLAESKIINKHSHILFLSRTIIKDTSIRQYLHDLPAEERFENHVQNIKEKFNLTKCQAKCLKDRVFWKFKDEDHMLKKFTERKIQFRRKLVTGKTSILMLVTENMKKSYERLGDILCFDITYKLIKKKVGEARHAGVGFFVGHDGNSRIVLYGVSTIDKETSENFQILFDFFFDIMGHLPQTILTDDQKTIGYALQNLKVQKKYTYVHLLDWYHKMEALKRILKREAYSEQLFSLFNRLLKEPSKQVYFDIVTEIATFLRKKNTMLDFIAGQDKFCLAYVPATFFAFGISSTRAESFNSLIKRSVPHQTNFGRFMFFVLRVEKRLLNRMAVLNYMNKQITKHIQDFEMGKLTDLLEHLAYEQMRQYYEESRAFLEVAEGCSPIHKIIRYERYERTYKFHLFYDIKFNCWRCECMNNFRTGMPCSHLVRIVRDNGGCIAYYINQRWIHDKQNAVVKKAMRPPIKTKKI